MAVKNGIFALVLLLLTAGCAGFSPDYFKTGELTAMVPGIAGKKLNGKYVVEGLEALEGEKFNEANKAFGSALKFDPDNSSLHFLNGLSYYFRGMGGDSSQYELAMIGFKHALQFNAGNFWAAYFMGQMHFKNRSFSDAQEAFAYALLYGPEQPDVLHALAASSYYARDLKTAKFAIEKAQQLRPNDPRMLRTATMILAAAGQFGTAESRFQSYQKLSLDPPYKKSHMKGRVREWKDFYARNLLYRGGRNRFGFGGNLSRDLNRNDFPSRPLLLRVQGSLAEDILGGKYSKPGIDVQGFDDENGDDDQNGDQDDTGGDAADGGGAKKAEKIPRMALVDVTIIRSQERYSTSKGVNLLAGLKLTYSQSFIDKTFDATTNTLVNQKGVASLKATDITYSLNIFNSKDDRNEVLARPTLVVLDGKTSEFFSGAVLNVQIPGTDGGQGTVSTIPVGIVLNIRASSITEDRITLKVTAQRAFFETAAPEAGNFQNFSQTSKTAVQAYVSMRFGQTLILSGLNERVTERATSGVPLLKDIPIIQYFFSTENTQEFTKSVLILLTPRKPRYTYEDGSKKIDAGEADSKPNKGPNLKELQSRFDWIKPAPNIDAALYHLNKKNVMTQFRTGDVTMERWDDPDLIRTSILRNLQFLYY